MKIAICSDTHDNLVNISTFLYYCNYHEIETIFHCGDWCSPSVLEFFRENFKGKIYGVYGNVHADAESMQSFAEKHDITLQEEELEIEIDKIKFILTHYPDNAKMLAKKEEYHIVFYGHSHQPWKEKIQKTYIINPGTLAGMFYRASFALYDTETKDLELILLDQIKEPAA
mgnify:CR=1 FL=1